MSFDVIFGISSVGKSTYIEKHYQSKIVRFPDSINENNLSLLDGCVIHYNALRPWSNIADNFDASIEHDKVARLIFKETKPSIVKILITYQSILKARAQNRELIESKLSPHTKSDYPKEKIIKFITEIGQSPVYELWISYFEKNNINKIFILTGDNFEYIFLTQEQALRILRNQL